LNQLAIAYSSQGRYDAAEQLQVHILSASQQPWRANHAHPRILSSMELLAVNYKLLGRLEETSQLLVRVTGARIRLQGEEHPDTLKSMQRAVMSYADLGRGREAETLLTKVIDVSERKLGGEHPDT
ncbi:hypothetical protein B0J17DRAFT_545901, partial [Rhizoctonia solani]